MLTADPRKAELIAEMRDLLPQATPEQRARITEMIAACLLGDKKQSQNQDYLDER